MKSQLLELDKKHLSTLRKLVIVGDLHGDYASLRSVLDNFDLTKDGLMFLGDYADRGKSGVEVIGAIDALIKKNIRKMCSHLKEIMRTILKQGPRNSVRATL